MRPAMSHSWEITPRQAIALQEKLAAKNNLTSRCNLRRVTLVAGTDVSYSQTTDMCYGGVVLWDYRRGKVTAEVTAVRRARFPYVPGLLSFREMPVLVAAFAKLKSIPDLIVAEAHGLAHPRRFGLACHLGLFFDLPALGCAKTRLVGEYQEPGDPYGSYSLLRYQDKTIGVVLRTRSGVKPVFVSQGHGISLTQCRRAVLRLTGRFRMPNLLRRAHALANELRVDYESTES